jgi:hypothetical protein
MLGVSFLYKSQADRYNWGRERHREGNKMEGPWFESLVFANARVAARSVEGVAVEVARGIVGEVAVERGVAGCVAVEVVRGIAEEIAREVAVERGVAGCVAVEVSLSLFLFAGSMGEAYASILPDSRSGLTDIINTMSPWLFAKSSIFKNPVRGLHDA